MGYEPSSGTAHAAPGALGQRVMRVLQVETWLIAISLLAACGDTEAPTDGTEVPFKTILHPRSAAIEVREGFVARDQKTFDALWLRHSSHRMPRQPSPDVDFSVSMVVGYALGSRPAGCYGVSIKRVTRARDRLTVTYKEEGPAVGAPCTATIVYPAHWIVVRKTPLPVAFVEE